MDSRFLKNHLRVGNAVFQIFFPRGTEAETFVKTQQIGLGTDLDGCVAKQATARCYALLHEQFARPRAACRRGTDDPSDRSIVRIGDAFGQKTGITTQLLCGIASHQMPRGLVAIICVQIGTVLLYDEDFLSQLHEVIEFPYGQFVERFA